MAGRAQHLCWVRCALDIRNFGIRIGSKGWARWALDGRLGSRRPLAGQPAGGCQHLGADVPCRLRPSGVRLTTNLEL
ncbi:hypothetical protein Trco_006551, partial [Trichoderma cornu-damae]